MGFMSVVGLSQTFEMRSMGYGECVENMRE